MISIRDLPAINATAAILLIWGYTLIRRYRHQTHKRVIRAAFMTSCAFLTFYLIYHAHVGSVPFPDSGAIRTHGVSRLGAADSDHYLEPRPFVQVR